VILVHAALFRAVLVAILTVFGLWVWLAVLPTVPVLALTLPRRGRRRAVSVAREGNRHADTGDQEPDHGNQLDDLEPKFFHAAPR
jgi:hypothetical protein